MTEPAAWVNKIVDHSVVDGPGNRTAIFFQACNFRCTYCHNPETINLCNHCGACVSHCPSGALSWPAGQVAWDESICIGCDQCIRVCPHWASPKVRRMTAPELAKRIFKNRPFIRGITCSGGECTLSAEVMTRLFLLTREMGLQNLIDSNGSYDFFADRALLDLSDGVMLDIKALDPQAHRMLTGADNFMVLQNAVRLAAEGKLPEIRTVVVPDALPNLQTVEGVTRLLAPFLEYGDIRYRLIRFRPMGVRGEGLGYQTPDDALMQSLREAALRNGFYDVVIV